MRTIFWFTSLVLHKTKRVQVLLGHLLDRGPWTLHSGCRLAGALRNGRRPKTHACAQRFLLFTVVLHATRQMREDLPYEEPLPRLWTISLATGGDLIGALPRLEEFDILQPLQFGASRCRCWRVQGNGDVHGTNDRHVLREFRYCCCCSTITYCCRGYIYYLG